MATKLEFCLVCGRLADCYRYRKEWLCLDCPKSEIDQLLGETVLPSPAPPPSIRDRSNEPSKKEKEKENVFITLASVKKDKPKTAKSQSTSLTPCDRALLSLLESNPNQFFRSYEIPNLIPNFSHRNIAARLCFLAQIGKIYSRKLHTKNRPTFAIYSCDRQLVLQPIPEEGLKTIPQYVLDNYNELLTTKKIASMFDVSTTTVKKKLRSRTDIVTFPYCNRNFYFPAGRESEIIPRIQASINWACGS